MRRDFSEDAKKTFLNLVEDVNNGGLDAILDCFSSDPDIKDYLNDLNTYHQKIIDKNNTTADQINTIFNDVRRVDLCYQIIFDSCCNAITDQIEYIKGLSDCINPLKSNFTVEHIQKTMQSRAHDVYSSTIDYYKAMLIHSDGDGHYDYDYFQEIMSMNPEEIPKEMYVAMIDIFYNMNTEEKEKFINSSYIYIEPDPDPNHYPYIPNTDPADPYDYFNQYNLSDVFKQMVLTNRDLLYDDNNTLNNKYLYNYNLMSSIVSQCDSIYVHGNVLSTTIRYPENGTIDFTISFNGGNSPEFTPPLSIDGYYKRNGQSVSNIFVGYAVDLVETLKDDGFSTAISLAETATSEALTVVASVASSATVASFATVLSGPIGVSITILGTILDYNSIIATNNRIDDIKILLNTGNFYEAFAVTDCCFSVRNDGQYFISYFEVDEETLYWRLEAWKEKKHVNIDYDENDIILALSKGDFSNLEGIDDFINWCTKEDGIEKAEDYRKDHS